MPDLDLIKQGEQGVRDRRGRFASRLENMLGTTVSVAQAKSQFAALVARAEAGERIVVTRNGPAVACLGPFPRRQPIKYGELNHVFLSEDLTTPEEVIRDFEPST
jgi:prevent-host-death family protein